MLALSGLRGLIVSGEVHLLPDLFRTLRVLADDPAARRRFLVLCSAAPELLRQGAETLAERIAYHELSGFRPDEVGLPQPSKRWVRGGFPRSFLASSDIASDEWREQFIRTFIERDIPLFGLRIPAPALRRFRTLIAHYHAQTWNSAELARALGVTHTTVQRYLDVLTETFMVRQLPPWHENLSKRQLRAPKVYLRDTELLHTLLGVRNLRDLQAHPKVGASWEGFAIDVDLDHLGARSGEAYFWGTHASAELDLLIVRGSTRVRFEFKRTSSPSVTPSMRSALSDLRLQRIYVVHGGAETFPLTEKILAVPLSRIAQDVPPL
ncbi:ATP-binding protein [Gemmatimonas sp.]|uniref:ATP-binding protein n=1 Tax=Gemmatimonas sp. TaxID=1962908 RepID=UPI003561B86B